MTSPQGVLLCQNKSQLSNLQNRHREKLFNPPFLAIWKSMERSEIMFSDQKCVKKPFSIWPLPRGSCFAKIRVCYQTFIMDIERSFFNPPFFDHMNINGKVRNHVFSSEECKKAHFSIWPLPRWSCFAKIRVSCQTFIMDIERSFFNPPFVTIWKSMERSEIMFSHQKNVKKPFFLYNLSPWGLVLPK